MDARAKKVTVRTLRAMKEAGERITMLTAYDFPFAEIMDEAGVDVILVGDSVGYVVQGGRDSFRVTMDQMAYHTGMVARARKRALLVADMPFLSFQVSDEETIRNAGRLIAEGAEAVKLEGGTAVEGRIRRLTEIGLPVMGHVGLTPQSVNAFGGFVPQRDEERIMADARAVERGGAFSIVLEGMPEAIAQKVTAALAIPTIGIGAGRFCGGQVLVMHDVLGLCGHLRPRFVKVYDNLAESARAAFGAFVSEVRAGQFPEEKHGY
ncbi:MAG: 3-methyl-2-oxobutanoate hydroxymethyltransferase [Planctomycetes bacterium]|nr:3-methyl-2-oxobutanoate hydroxymethyltransferase [Planctomycetota bacterium]